MLSIFGEITPPEAVSKLSSDTNGNGIFVLLNRIFTLIGMAAGIFFVIQILLAGFAYISASGDQKKTEAAWSKIYQSIIGLVIVSSAFVITAVVGRLVGIENILEPDIEKTINQSGGSGGSNSSEFKIIKQPNKSAVDSDPEINPDYKIEQYEQ